MLVIRHAFSSLFYFQLFFILLFSPVLIFQRNIFDSYLLLIILKSKFCSKLIYYDRKLFLVLSSKNKEIMVTKNKIVFA